MERFIEIKNFGVNLLTLLFFVTIFFTIIQAYALVKQNNKIVKNRSGKSVSFFFFSYYGFSALAVIVYGLNANSLALTINGLLGPLALIIVINLLRFKVIGLKEKLIGLSSFIVLPLIILVPQKDLLFLIFGLVISGALGSQILEIWKNKSAGSVHPGQAIVSLFSNSFWLSYALIMNIWPLKIVNGLGLLLWVIMLMSYFKFKPTNIPQTLP